MNITIAVLIMLYLLNIFESILKFIKVDQNSFNQFLISHKGNFM